MSCVGLPEQQGLYDPQFEHDNCGIGFIADIKGKKSHQIINDAIQILEKLAHRGGVGSEPDTGDGAGILIQIPHNFMKKVCQNEGITLPGEGDYAVGMLFLSPDLETRTESLKKLENIIDGEGLEYLGMREVPTYAKCIGESARTAMPRIVQVFIKRPKDTQKGIPFERKLYLVLKRSEREIRNAESGRDPYFYFASLSSRTIVYKGMLTPQQVTRFYLDLMDLDMQTAIAMVHSRFSTNTFPSWERAHPNRYLVHNGEINTIRGNVNWTHAREKIFETDIFGEDITKIYPVINEDGSDSAMLDNYIQMLELAGFSLPKAIMMSVPEPWENDNTMDKAKRAFYQYNSTTGEAWDGPAAIGFTDGTLIGAVLDRNGLRPARYYVTSDNKLILSSEVGVLNVPEENIIEKNRLEPGKMLLVDTKNGRVIPDEEIKASIASEFPYEDWVKDNMLDINTIKSGKKNDFEQEVSELSLLTKQKAFGYNYEDVDLTLKGIAETGEDPITAMGTDTPLACLSDKPQLLYNYFKQLFAQVTNPPIDAIREEMVTGTNIYLGGERNMLEPKGRNCRRIKSATPILTDKQLMALKTIDEKDFKAVTLPMLYDPTQKEGLTRALDDLFAAADTAIGNKYNIIILSDRGVNEKKCAIPALLAGAGLHHHLIAKGTRLRVSIVLETGEPREVHHFAVLLGYGVNAVDPYLAYETLADMAQNGFISKSAEDAIDTYINAVTHGIIKIMSKMGISTVQSYMGAQIFEALGISKRVVEKYFTGTATRIGGITIKHIAREAEMRHDCAFDPVTFNDALQPGGDYKWRRGGEYHMYNPRSIYLLQKACREGDYKLYKEFAKMMNETNEQFCTIRGLLDIRTNDKPINIDDVESVDSIVKRFKTGAMSYGSISKEAHECMAIAMNRLGGKSNSGEGGEEAERFIPDENGDSRMSAIKQVASGRFGVTINYLQNAIEIQIKMAQGAKPGEGGHLPGKKVYPWIAKARNSTPGVALISPPPHHDIYSIEDLAQLIHDLKNANRNARISVKLVSEAGVGTIAVGVAKGLADVILVSGYDGGTGAAPRTSVRHAGLPWELGIAETHQALLMNNLRNRVVIETDGKLLTGRDVAVACLLGAEEFGFATGPLVTMGCVMMRVCNLDTCPVGVATQNPELRKKFRGKPEYVENFMRFIAQDLREWMAKIGVRTVNEMVGHVEKLVPKHLQHWKAKEIDLTSMLYQPKICSNDNERYFNVPQNHQLEKCLDVNALVRLCAPAINDGKKISAALAVGNTDRVCGAILSSEITKKYGEQGLPDDLIDLDFEGSAGQSFGAFQTHGVTMKLIGDANDYIGKGLSGGRIVVVPSPKAKFKANENIIIGNVAFYGAISGEAYINGIAGERFCVRNSGIKAVVEGVGRHGCEYMTGGRVAILGKVGKNFAAGMSGGVAYVYDKDGTLDKKCNKSLVLLEQLSDSEDIEELKEMLEKHLEYTNSQTAKAILENWDNELKHFVKVIPEAYKEMVTEIKRCKASGLSDEDAIMDAFIEVSGTTMLKKTERSAANG